MMMVIIIWMRTLCACIVEDKKDDKSDARTDSFKSQPDVDSYDYGDESHIRRKHRKDYLPVFVPEEEKIKRMQFFLSL